MHTIDFFDGDILEYQWCFSESKEIEVTLDPTLISSISTNNPHLIIEESPFRIKINLFKLILAVGCIKSPRTKPTDRQYFLEKCYLLESIQNSSEFKIFYHKDSEFKQDISEELGIGLSVLIADYFYNIQWSTLAKIPLIGRQSKPDIKCFTSQSQEMVIEAKGTINKSTRKIQKAHSLEQKIKMPADIRVSSCSLLKNESISDVEFIDPPVVPPTDKKYTELLLKADHYSRMFNFIGQKELSLYFNLMRKRIINDKEFPEYSEKDELFNKIKNDYIQISKFGKTFLGNIEKDNSGKFIFLGADKDLISLKGFIEFKDYKIDLDISENDPNFYYISPDGLCFARLTDIRFLQEQLGDQIIPHYQESTSIIDIDSMNNVAFENYILYLFEKLNCTVLKDKELHNKNIDIKMAPDLVVICDDKKVSVEIKKSLKVEKLDSIYHQLISCAEIFNCQKLVLFTAKAANKEIFDQARKLNITLVDRNTLKQIIENNSLLLEYLK